MRRIFSVFLFLSQSLSLYSSQLFSFSNTWITCAGYVQASGRHDGSLSVLAVHGWTCSVCTEHVLTLTFYDVSRARLFTLSTRRHFFFVLGLKDRWQSITQRFLFGIVMTFQVSHIVLDLHFNYPLSLRSFFPSNFKSKLNFVFFVFRSVSS